MLGDFDNCLDDITKIIQEKYYENITDHEKDLIAFSLLSGASCGVVSAIIFYMRRCQDLRAYLRIHYNLSKVVIDNLLRNPDVIKIIKSGSDIKKIAKKISDGIKPPGGGEGGGHHP